MKRLYVLYCMLVMLSVVFCSSCSSTQKISVKQEQEGQVQETVIESDTKVNSFAIVITSDKIEYNGSVYRPSTRRAANQAKRYADAQRMQANAGDVKLETDVIRQYLNANSPNTQYLRG